MAVNYGGVMNYAYDELDESGKTVQKSLRLAFNAVTLITYRNYTGREFLTDFFGIGTKGANKIKAENKAVYDKIASGGEVNIEDLTEEDINAINGADLSANLQFFIDATAAMIATYEYPKKRDFVEIISELPLFVLMDGDYLTQMIEFIAFGLKKNSPQLQKLLQAQAKQN